ncbi:nucleotidyltransferase family protein [Bacillus sp. J33]|uniref:nucleotidyltransferase family protein n=1 Tax=Bacillus sp. J33 TaxID=935836 RepID=UPI000479CCBF|nr:nucleotidyltransferase family protein [Bacillus sp. J33]
MVIKSEEDIVKAIKEDEWMMNLLKAVKKLDLPDWWICAGFVRSKIWDILHNFTVRTPLPDIDVIYFDPEQINELEEKKLEEKLLLLVPDIPWSVKNQARMHIRNKMAPYSSSVDAISKFTETVTALGVKLDEKDNVILTAPWGITDVVNLEVKPTPYYSEANARINFYEHRIKKKNWKLTWDKVKIYLPGGSN